MQAPSKLERINKLLDLAKAKTKSDYATAKLIGSGRQTLSKWRIGKSCPIEKQAQIAELAGLSAIEVVAYAMIEGAKDAAEKERIYTAVGKQLHPTNVAEFLPTSGKEDLASNWSHFIRCILC
jgi:hypothetical protein